MPDVRERIDIPHIDVGSVTTHVLRSLDEAGIRGKYQVVDLYRQGHGKRVLAVVVISVPVASSVELREPSTDVIYLQTPGGWKKIPSQVRTLNRHILIRPPDAGDNDLGSFRTRDVSGGGTVFGVPRPDR